jgi:hypothetical protein
MALGVLGVAPASRAALFPFNATLQLDVVGVYSVALFGAGYGLSEGGGLVTLPAGVFAGNPTVYVPINTGISTVLGFTALSIPANSLDNPAGSLNPNGAMGLSGTLFFLGANSAQVPLTPVGGGGNVAGTFGGVPITVQGATWMGGTQLFTHMGLLAGIPFSAVATAFDNRTAGGDGVVQLVAPATVSAGLLGSVPLFAVLTIDYTPEPGTLALLGVGIAGLAARGRVLRRGRA